MTTTTPGPALVPPATGPQGVGRARVAGGTAPVTIRPTRPGDLASLLALLDRCSPETRYRRFHASTLEPMRDEMARVAADEGGRRSWVAVGPDGALRGTGTLAWPPGGEPEAALLVEDGWFRRGIGRALVRALAAAARRAGAADVVAWVQADNLRAVRFLRAVAPGARLAFDGGELVVRLPVAGPDVGAGRPATRPGVDGPVTVKHVAARTASAGPAAAETAGGAGPVAARTASAGPGARAGEAA